MLDWLKRRFTQRPPAPEPVDPDVAMTGLRQLTSDAAYETVSDALDSCADTVAPTVYDAISSGELGSYPMHAARIWLAYHFGSRDQFINEDLAPAVGESIAWALQFDENTVLLGAAVGALDGIPTQIRETIALQAFAAAGSASPRRYWLLLKIRSRAMLQVVFESLAQWQPPPGSDLDPDDEQFVYTPTDANRMAGAFRQFEHGDFPTLAPFINLDSPGAQFMVEAAGATGHPDALPVLQRAAADPRPAVNAAAARWLRQRS